MHAAPATKDDFGQPTWLSLDIPGRMAIVLERFRFLLDETVSKKHFESQPETCDLTDAQIEANVGKALQLLEAGPLVEPTYDRETQIRLGVKALLGILPGRDAITERLALIGLKPAEINDMRGEIVTRAADAFAEREAKPDVSDLYPGAVADLAKNAN